MIRSWTDTSGEEFHSGQQGERDGEMRDTFRHKITLERFTTSDLGGGSKSKAWSAIHTDIPCLIVIKQGYEKLESGKETVRSDGRVFCAYLKNPTITEKDRIKWTNPNTDEINYFQILFIKPLRTLGDEMRIDFKNKDMKA